MFRLDNLIKCIVFQIFPYFEVEAIQKEFNLVAKRSRHYLKPASMATRLEATQMIEKGLILRTELDSCAIVKSSTVDHLEYSVDVKKRTCECIAFLSGKVCKHLVAAKAFLNGVSINLDVKGKAGLSAQYRARYHGSARYASFGPNVTVRRKPGSHKRGFFVSKKEVDKCSDEKA